MTAHYNDGSSASSFETVSVAPGLLSNCLSPTVPAARSGPLSYETNADLAPALAVHAKDVSHCFVVNEMVKSEEYRYFVDAVSKCSREYDAVYVMVFVPGCKGRLSRQRRLGYLLVPARSPGNSRSLESRREPQGFDRVVLRKVTVDSMEALR